MAFALNPSSRSCSQPPSYCDTSASLPVLQPLNATSPAWLGGYKVTGPVYEETLVYIDQNQQNHTFTPQLTTYVDSIAQDIFLYDV